MANGEVNGPTQQDRPETDTRVYKGNTQYSFCIYKLGNAVTATATVAYPSTQTKKTKFDTSCHVKDKTIPASFLELHVNVQFHNFQKK